MHGMHTQACGHCIRTCTLVMKDAEDAQALWVVAQFTDACWGIHLRSWRHLPPSRGHQQAMYNQLNQAAMYMPQRTQTRWSLYAGASMLVCPHTERWQKAEWHPLTYACLPAGPYPSSLLSLPVVHWRLAAVSRWQSHWHWVMQALWVVTSASS